MSIKKYYGLLNIKQQAISSIDSFIVDPKNLVTNGEKKEAAKHLIDMVSKLNGAISLQPIPFADIFLLTPIQVNMVMKIAHIYNKNLDSKVIREVISTVFKGVLARTFAKSLVKFIPILGSPLYFVISYIMTQAIGIAAIKAFETNSDFNIETVKENFEKEFKKSDKVNVIIKSAVSIKQISTPEPLIQRAKRTDLKQVQEETKRTIIYLPCEN